MSTATRTRVGRTDAAVVTTLDLAVRMRQLEVELNRAFLQRAEVIRAVLICLLARENGFIMGPPGTAKSELLEAVAKAFLARYFRVLMDRQMGKEDLAGAVDVPDYVQTGHWGRDITDSLADAHIALLDETDKTGPIVLNMTLTMLNEHTFKPNGKWIDIPLISAFGAANGYLEEAPAFWDRFMIRIEVDYLADDADFERLYERACGADTAPQITTQIPLEDLQRAIEIDVPAVVIPPGVRDAVRQLRTDLRAEQIVPSDRRWAKTARLIKASAFLNGRTIADEDDLQILQHVLWDQPTEMLTVKRKVMSLMSPVARAAAEIAGQLDSLSAEVDARRGKSVDERAAFGGTAHYQIGEIVKKVTATREQANREGRSTTALDALADQIKGLRAKVYVECLNVTPERAAVMP